ncbi:polygalacturonase-like [Magnolia sinica]|uniref:polygalacturonase-like n=1 Tax=Magnolia sinica TaxID=86752 RepID=UPI0026581A7C|nr:polygalacturonase-like [Magnolia sinica]
MGLQRQLVPIIMLWFFYSSCYSNLLEDPHSAFNHKEPTYDKRAHRTYFSAINKWRQISTPNHFGRSILSSSRFDNVGSRKSSDTVVNVNDFGAKGDGTDDTKAFEKAWTKACSSAPSVLVVPANKNYLLKPITFSGPCISSITVMILGTIEAPSHPSAWDRLDQKHWLNFRNVQNLRVQGGGTINGNGEMWWKNSCKINKALPCKDAPTALTFYSCNNLIVNDLKIKDSQQIQVSFERCVNALAFNLIVTAPGTSPNTDGIHITKTQNIQIMNSVIRTGDDCISIESGSHIVKVMNITCGPGHGISIGSLGDNKSEAHVSQVIVDGATLFGTTNGVRIKTWQGGSGSATNITFQNIVMHNVKRPIIIDQSYCDSKYPCPKKGSAVEVSDVVYKNIRGTSASYEAVTFNCSRSSPCKGIVLQDIDLVGHAGKKTSRSCNNVRGSTIGKVVPPSCF